MRVSSYCLASPMWLGGGLLQICSSWLLLGSINNSSAAVWLDIVSSFVVVVRLKPSHTFQSRGKKTPFMHVHEIKTSVAAAVAEQFCSMPVIQQRRSSTSLFGKSRLSSKCDKKNRWSLTWKLFVTVNIRLPDAICFFIMRIPGSSVTISSNATIKNGERQLVWQQLFSHFADFHDFQKWLPPNVHE